MGCPSHWTSEARSERSCSVSWFSWDTCSGRIQLPCLTTLRLSCHRGHVGYCDWQSQLCPNFQPPYQDIKRVKEEAVMDTQGKPVYQLSSTKWLSSMRWGPEELFNWELHEFPTCVIHAVWWNGCCFKPLEDNLLYSNSNWNTTE